MKTYNKLFSPNAFSQSTMACCMCMCIRRGLTPIRLVQASHAS